MGLGTRAACTYVNYLSSSEIAVWIGLEGGGVLSPSRVVIQGADAGRGRLVRLILQEICSSLLVIYSTVLRGTNETTDRAGKKGIEGVLVYGDPCSSC